VTAIQAFLHASSRIDRLAEHLYRFYKWASAISEASICDGFIGSFLHRT